MFHAPLKKKNTNRVKGHGGFSDQYEHEEIISKRQNYKWELKSDEDDDCHA